MAFTVAVIKEERASERRVAMVPAVLPKLAKLGAQLRLQAGAGVAARFADVAYAGATVLDDAQEVVAGADLVLAVQAPSLQTLAAMRPGSMLVALLYPAKAPGLLELLCERRITAFAMETVPRISRAQALDVLSSQAALAGYYAPLLGAVHLPRILPMMTTAVGSLRAARVLVMGLGVAGLQALATAHRLGAITEGYDVRPETREQAQSVGAKFVDTGIDARGEGGYARELTADERAKAAAVLTQHIQQADMIVTTANVPGRTAPILIDRAQIDGMKPGAVIVDLAADSGGNCEGSVPGQTVEVGPVTIVAPFNVPSALAQHASELYAKNLLNLLELLVRDGALAPDFDDEVVAGTLLTRDGQRCHPTPQAVAPAPAAKES
ncbi:NAD(P) transhydrogenase subunit alpha [Xanthomonas hyacinthi]|uniref:proton-translocating NAD(P)(+) transhydrogenase n=1 Tax=Xanthomonas hyacinthi TaxID=56455 RepID=A0A2S7EWU5_9XANT|nr:NAD(P) transhydrogenase subunit alpha [Xanthomonas hyacinthi]PPU97566.1 NAD(P) transhydrogenase subunit alpha [Xanthomonas hyacinthi]QGY77351.1 NAD(P) transhydrogenase subunit alpha [Xanthomonas hyacinthi]